MNGSRWCSTAVTFQHSRRCRRWFQRSSTHGGARLQNSRWRRSRLQQALWRCRVSALAVQVLDSGGTGCSRFQPWVEVKAFSKSLESFKTAIVVGGTNISDQRSELRAGVDIVVATPRRFIDHLQQGNSSLSRVSFVVLDEAKLTECLTWGLNLR
ncbi:uncharacterized protein LOC133833861 [Humulus lupulus]|uniref:uncharacterized protein LOC133833861 n=1 Tax=Humulus lupulus TaxID=3486 RepID=UPI002B4013FB|nr:uncharacterized protein LOC133833861 [Humulus lupulus]